MDRRSKKRVCKKETEKQRRYPCTECEKSYSTQRYLITHINVVHRQIKLASCTECGKNFSAESGLKKHIDSVHQGMIVKCDICSKNFTNKAGLLDHKKRVHLKEFKLNCDVCNKWYFYASELKQHMKIIHEGKVVIYNCKQEGCEKVFRSRSGLKHHFDAEHVIEKPAFLCGQCGKSYDHLSKFQKHLWRHKIACSPYKCTICEKTVNSKESLHSHMLIHTGEKPFVCELCGRSFNKMFNLKTHMVVHTKEKPFACKFCDKRYTQQGSLTQHIRTCSPGVVKTVGCNKIVDYKEQKLMIKDASDDLS